MLHLYSIIPSYAKDFLCCLVCCTSCELDQLPVSMLYVYCRRLVLFRCLRGGQQKRKAKDLTRFRRLLKRLRKRESWSRILDAEDLGSASRKELLIHYSCRPILNVLGLTQPQICSTCFERTERSAAQFQDVFPRLIVPARARMQIVQAKLYNMHTRAQNCFLLGDWS